MEFVVSIIAIALMLIGAFGVILLKKPLDKVIMFSIMVDFIFNNFIRV